MTVHYWYMLPAAIGTTAVTELFGFAGTLYTSYSCSLRP